MRRSQTDLIVPIRDRRQRRRILTLKNFRNAVLIGLAVFAGLTIEANLRDRHAPKDDFGRLYGRQMPNAKVAPKQTPIASAPIADEDAADPMLVQAQARAQLLQADSNVPATTTPLTAASAMAAQPSLPHDASAERVTLVGGPEGVTLVKKNAEKPVLGGGFGRQ